MAIVGPSGTGKTLMALRMAGLAAAGEPTSDEAWPFPASRAAFVPTDPYLMFSGIKATLGGEMELSLQFLGRSCYASRSAISRTVAALKLEALLDRDPFTLSGGEAMRAALAVATVKGPRRLVTDEIYDALSTSSVTLVRGYIASLRAAGCEVVEVFNRSPEWLAEYDDIRRLGDPGDEAETSRSGRAERATHSARRPPELSTVLAATNLRQRYDSGFQLGPVDLEVRKGEWIAIVGANGAGKTTLLKSLAGLTAATFDRLTLAGLSLRAPGLRAKQRRCWPRAALYVFQNPDDQIYRATVRDELRETTRWIGGDPDERRLERVSSILELSADWHVVPSELPRPRRRLVTVGSALIAAPPILLLDEPTSGLDSRQREKLGRAIEDYRSDGGTVVMITHDQSFIAHHADRLIDLRDGNIVLSGDA